VLEVGVMHNSKLLLAAGVGIVIVGVGISLFLGRKRKSKPDAMNKKIVSPPRNFQQARDFVSENAEWISSLPDTTQLQLYALFKQVTMGMNTTAKPSALNFVAVAKWTAWAELGQLTSLDAEARYVHLLHELLTVARRNDGQKPKAAQERIGKTVSTPVEAQDESPDDIFSFSSSGDVAAVQSFLRGKGDVNAQDEAQMTPLHWAVSHRSPGNTAVAELLLRAGSVVNFPDEDGNTAYLLAAMSDNVEAVRLLEARVDLQRDIRNRDGACAADFLEESLYTTQRLENENAVYSTPSELSEENKIEKLG